MRDRIGNYRILRPLGEGGMGVVYAAHDDRLDRPVAVKTLRDARSEPRSRERFLREARAAARVSHPNVCPIYEVGEDRGELFLAMELLEGESLAARLARGPLPAATAIEIALAMLSALAALHRADVIHRDLKPSNVFLTPHGVRLLDFGLARPRADVDTALTQTGLVMGTPRYMAPEQIDGRDLDARTDLFAMGAVLFEMLSGRPAFSGQTVYEVLNAALRLDPPPLAGAGVPAPIERVVRRALAKRPADRPASAEAMAAELRAALEAGGGVATPTTVPSIARPGTRLAVLPLRVLKPDAETDFLSYALADAVSCSLSGLDSLSVRSPLVAARLAGESLDLDRLAREAEVDVVLAGSLMRAGDRVRVSVQLLEAPSGTVCWTQTAQVELRDLFELQDDLARHIVESLAVPLNARERGQLGHDVPASPEAYQLFLRANQLYLDTWQWTVARDLYRRCVELDPGFAPAWARLGRCHRVIAKYGSGATAGGELARAEEAFRKALELNPDLPVAHTLYSALEVELGRARESMTRLLARAESRDQDAELYAALCMALRYAGLLEASRAAHEAAMRIDPTVPTSGTFSYYYLGDYERAVEADRLEPRFISTVVMFDTGRIDDAIARARALEATQHQAGRLVSTIYRAVFEGNLAAASAAVDELQTTGFSDPEGWYWNARCLIRLGDVGRGLDLLRDVVRRGYSCHSTLLRDPWLERARPEPGFADIVREAEADARRSREAFLAAGGERILGPGSAA